MLYRSDISQVPVAEWCMYIKLFASDEFCFYIQLRRVHVFLVRCTCIYVKNQER